MKKFFNTENKVKEILEKYPATRNDDWFLFMTFWHLYAPDGVDYVTYYHKHWEYQAPSYKAIERCRRKLQERFPELKETKTAEKRLELSTEYEQYALNG